ncbi:hypothetical protein DVH24_020078 [Malus domestica]|uniref:Uncharacterized protein n=1 Tax=Malus domestica TaxID=3750 RepID=A0A498J8B5_MALDO|nr:hypothetical protein DVH24_020078 [Malus domestica]
MPKIKYTALHSILLDEMQHAVEACTTEMDYEIVASKIEAGSCYEIMGFRTNRMRVLCHMIPRLCSLGKQFSKNCPVCFRLSLDTGSFLQDYNTLYPRLNKVDILTDVIGHVTGVQELEPKQINQRIAHKCDIAIENIRKEEMKITLWEDDFFFFVNGGVICINNCCFHKSKSEAIPWFSNNTEAVKILAPSSKQVNEAQILQIARRVTIDELAFLDLELYVMRKRHSTVSE